MIPLLLQICVSVSTQPFSAIKPAGNMQQLFIIMGSAALLEVE